MTKIQVVCKVLITKGNNKGQYIYPKPEIMEDFFINYGTILKWALDPTFPNQWLEAKVIHFYKEYDDLFVECEQYEPTSKI